VEDIQASQPVEIQSLIELPDTCVLADYVTGDQMTLHIDLAKQLAESQSEDVFISIGFHVDSIDEDDFNAHMVKALQKGKGDKSVKYLTIADAGARFKS
jgi:hypothetical protein